MDKQKGISTLIVIIIIIAVVVVSVVGVLLYQYLATQPVGPTQPSLTQEQAEAIVLQTWGGCTPNTCESVTVTVENNNGQYIVTALIEGLRDDSVSAQKKVAPAYYSNNIWTLGNPTITQQCQFNRGHQDFSSVPCI
jgi:flagellar basal body-associated protein FliL